MDARSSLTALVREQACQAEAWRSAEVHLLGGVLAQRLVDLGVRMTPDVAVALMATATLLGEHTPEWGGDARESLGEVALLGLRLLEDAEPVSPA